MIITKKDEMLGFSSSSKKIKQISMRVINLLQDYKRGDIVITLAVLWLGVCERFDVRPVEVMSVANRIRTQTYDSKYNKQFRALKSYMEEEL